MGPSPKAAGHFNSAVRTVFWVGENTKPQTPASESQQGKTGGRDLRKRGFLAGDSYSVESGTGLLGWLPTPRLGPECKSHGFSSGG